MNYKQLLPVTEAQEDLEKWGIFYMQLTKQENREIKRRVYRRKNKEVQK